MAYQDPDNLMEGAAIIFIVATNIRTIPPEVEERITSKDGLEEFQELKEAWSNALICGLIEMGFEHDEVHDRASEMLKETEDKRENEIVSNMLDQVDDTIN